MQQPHKIACSCKTVCMVLRYTHWSVELGSTVEFAPLSEHGRARQSLVDCDDCVPGCKLHIQCLPATRLQ